MRDLPGKYGFIHIALIILVLCACAGNRVQRINLLFEHRWKLVELEGKAIVDSGERQPYAVFNASSNQVYGSGGCNRFSGTYQVVGQKITVEELISTKMACIDIDYENDFLRILESSNEYVISGDSLMLKKGGFISARFVLSDSALSPPATK